MMTSTAKEWEQKIGYDKKLCDQIWMTDLVHLLQRNINARLLKLLYHFV